ncbi:DUF2530 domain-containing protein [Actinotalea sp. K2]|uniref:DUF2530 domain-containing protein n=1 Tax=Actinotalea sp. K2 TaxID=2939438 RepID=UPI002017CCE2|nr:DUF2530 domain-containing protein [Actinotalea sp. K2]MCL3861535.1 DUF2530 domain-containing protein [Actinotalea sp. K2]
MTPDRPPRTSLLAPSALDPVEVDLRRVFGVGVGAWTVSLIVTGVLALTGATDGRGAAISLAGLLLGFVALGWEHRRRRRGRSGPSA